MFIAVLWWTVSMSEPRNIGERVGYERVDIQGLE